MDKSMLNNTDKWYLTSVYHEVDSGSHFCRLCERSDFTELRTIKNDDGEELEICISCIERFVKDPIIEKIVDEKKKGIEKEKQRPQEIDKEREEKRRRYKEFENEEQNDSIKSACHENIERDKKVRQNEIDRNKRSYLDNIERGKKVRQNEIDSRISVKGSFSKWYNRHRNKIRNTSYNLAELDVQCALDLLDELFAKRKKYIMGASSKVTLNEVVKAFVNFERYFAQISKSERKTKRLKKKKPSKNKSQRPPNNKNQQPIIMEKNSVKGHRIIVVQSNINSGRGNWRRNV